MTTVLEDLKRQLEHAKKTRGPKSVVVKTLKAQIASMEAPGESAFDLYVTGPLEKPKTKK